MCDKEVRIIKRSCIPEESKVCVCGGFVSYQRFARCRTRRKMHRAKSDDIAAQAIGEQVQGRERHWRRVRDACSVHTGADMSVGGSLP